MSQGIDKNRTWPQFDKMCQNANKKFCTHQVQLGSNMKHARNRESVRQTWEVEVLLLNGWEWLQHLEYPSLKQEGEGAWQRAQKFFEHKLIHADLAFSAKMVINFIMHKQTLPSSPKHFGTKAFPLFLSLKLNQTSDDPIMFAHTHPS